MDWIKMATGKTVEEIREQAVIELKDCRAALQENPTLNEPSQGGLPGVSALTNVVENTVNAIANGTTSTTSTQTTRRFMVQFNPSELTLDANSHRKPRKDAETGRVITEGENEPHIYLATRLYFDDVEPYDAFMAEKLTVNPSTAAVANTLNTAQTLRGKNVHTVQPEVEALIAALRHPGTRRVTFRWADFVFCGTLQNVHAEYTMFSVSGRPIRAVVSLKLQHDMDSANRQFWYDAYNTAFGNGAKNLTKFQQNASNLLNVNL